MKFAWTRESEELLLEQVRDHRIVWDPKHVDYHRFKLRQEIFSQIADTIREQFPELKQLNGEHVRLKFKNIKTYFVTVYRKIQKTSDGSAKHPPQKWHLFEEAIFLADSMLDTNDTTKTVALSDTEQSSDLKMPALNLVPDGMLTKEERVPSLVSSEPQVVITSGFEVSNPLSSGYSSGADAMNIPSDGSIQEPSLAVSNADKLTVKPLETMRRKRPSNDNPDIDTCVVTLRNYIDQKKSVSVEASSMGRLVESSIDKLPYAKQIWFMQKLVQLIAEANDIPTTNV
ncbi:uncharacterized protein LOC123515812 isoform X2 [Portunus trituberculatus]|uniref:uncharacterized protein LOC123515812 isoform X2 n=1 Tax=Portunus trituberculatus TaxID=210409 RepID=UPI001E1D0AF2|nr:uncharacterized protein LOC123515812 isoform X2 [Portunus trituberculatus]